MKYKMSYLVYKMRKLWPILDTIAAYFYLVLFVTILAFALYFQLALFWAFSLTIYMVSQFINSRQNHKYRQEGFQKFYQKLENELMLESKEAAALQLSKSNNQQESYKKLKRRRINSQRLLDTEEKTLADRQTLSQQMLERKLQLKEIRQSKQGFSPKNSYIRIDSAVGENGAHISARFGGNLIVENDQAVLQLFNND